MVIRLAAINQHSAVCRTTGSLRLQGRRAAYCLGDLVCIRRLRVHELQRGIGLSCLLVSALLATCSTS